jgi:hypothetical protein
LTHAAGRLKPCHLPFLDGHGRSDHTEGALTVRYLGAKVGVGHGAKSIAEKDGRAVNSVSARLIFAPEVTASLVPRQCPVRTPMEIESWHDVPKLKSGTAKFSQKRVQSIEFNQLSEVKRRLR